MILQIFFFCFCLHAVTCSLTGDGYCQEYPESCDNHPLTIPNGNVTHLHDAQGKLALVFHCKNGYALQGKNILTCCGQIWEDTFPKCVPIDCKAHFDSGKTSDGSYIIYPYGKSPVAVYCDMSGQGGGWTVIQRRQDDSVDFFRNWEDYKHGFGHFNGNFWIGLNNLNLLTQRSTELYFYMKASKSEEAYARYSLFHVSDESAKFKLTLTGYSGTAGDGGAHQNGNKFSTFDSDNDVYEGNCAESFKGGWWYGNCHNSNPNGLYLNGPHSGAHHGQGIEWNFYKGQYHSMILMEMKIRRKK